MINVTTQSKLYLWRQDYGFALAIPVLSYKEVMISMTSFTSENGRP